MGVNSCGTTLIDNGTFKNIGAITWDTTAKTAGFTAVAGNGYFCNTTSAAFTVTLPSSPTAGDTVGISDYANTADTNNITIGRNGSNIQGVANDFIINTEGASVLLIYVDATKGWLSIDSAVASDIEGPTFITATGGTITTSGDYKIHTFTGPGTFNVTQIGNAPTFPAGGPSNVDYLVVAGGGGGGFGNVTSGGVGGAGAGGHRTSYPSPAGVIPVSTTGYPITVGGGGAGVTSNTGVRGQNGSDSIFSTITSTGGGGSSSIASSPAGTGGSGGGGSSFGGFNTGAAGNTPPVSPPQGNPGGNANACGGAGGGGASAAGANGGPGLPGAAGGAGSANSITGSSTTRAGGGGGGAYGPPSPGFAPGGAGGTGGGGAGGPTGNPGTPGTVNTGGGGGGSGGGGGPTGGGGNGGSGIVIIRYKFQ